MIITASDFVQSMLQQFGPTSVFPSSMGSLPGKAAAGASGAAPRALPPKPDGDESEANPSDVAKPEWSIAGLARNLLEEADWLPGVQGSDAGIKEKRVDGTRAGRDGSWLTDVSIGGLFVSGINPLGCQEHSASPHRWLKWR